MRVASVYGFGHEDLGAAWRDLEAFAKDRPNCKNYMFVISLNPEPGETLTDAQWTQAEAIALLHYDAEGQPYMSFEHEKNGRIHRHLAISRIERDTGRLISDAFTYKKNEAISREIEREMGLNVTPSVLVKDRETPRPKRRAKDYEGYRGKQTGLDPEQVNKEVTAAWRQTKIGIGISGGTCRIRLYPVPGRQAGFLHRRSGRQRP